jgi:hypothetical protein
MAERQEGVILPSITVKAYHNCKPVLDPATGKPALYDGQGFEIFNNTDGMIELGLEALNKDGLGVGTVDPSTTRTVKPREKVTLWTDDCAEPNIACDGQEGREILLLLEDYTSIPEYQAFVGTYKQAVCCEVEAEQILETCCEVGEDNIDHCKKDTTGTKCE